MFITPADFGEGHAVDPYITDSGQRKAAETRGRFVEASQPKVTHTTGMLAFGAACLPF